eukprot:11302851-Ditylum_brightwellii.AAC.1
MGNATTVESWDTWQMSVQIKSKAERSSKANVEAVESKGTKKWTAWRTQIMQSRSSCDTKAKRRALPPKTKNRTVAP